MDKGYLGLPRIKREDFNRISQLYFPQDGISWVNDKRNPGVIDPDEVRVDGPAARPADFVSKRGFTSLFDARYRQLVELRRQELVRQEVGRTNMIRIETDFSGESPERKRMIGHILKAGRIMEELFQMQLGSRPFRGQLLEGGTVADREMMLRYQQPWCESDPDPLCNGLSTFTPALNPMAPEGLSQERAAALGKGFVAPFSVVVSDGRGGYEAVPYAHSFLAPKMREAAGELRAAAGIAEQVSEEAFGRYLQQVAGALESGKEYPYAAADKAWYEMRGKTNLYLRIGFDEVQWDEWQKKAGAHMTFGLIDAEAAKSAEFYRSIRQKLEQGFAEVIGPPYAARQVDVELPDFVNVVMENGDARGSVTGSAAAQTLPNWCGEDGTAECQTRIMQFSNKTSRNYSPEVMAKYGALLSEADMRYFDPQATVKTMVEHELAHNFGPRQNLPAEDGRPLEQHIGSYSLKLEELKAQTGALYINGLLGKQKLRSEEEVKAGTTAAVLWMFGHLRRALPAWRQGTLHELKSPYIQLAAVQLGYLQEKGAIAFDEGSQRFTIRHEKMHGALADLLRDVGQMYLRHDSQEIVTFFRKYTTGQGLAALHMPAIDRAIGSLPSNLYDWQVKGIE